jgi:hypothetical protein
VTRVLVVAVLVLVCGLPGGLSAAELGFEPGAVRAIGVTPGAPVAWLVVSDESRSHRKIVAGVVDVVADSQGNSRIATGSTESPDALWIAVDLTSGSIAAATRGRGSLDVPVETTTPGGARQLGRRSAHLMLLLVRPAAGAWVRTAEDGSANDSDSRPDGNVTLSIAELIPLGASPLPPSSLRPGDVAIAADLHTLTVTVLQFR